ncbi:MAG TPA: peptidylprolyl isomerase [Myxococcales bacterium]
MRMAWVSLLALGCAAGGQRPGATEQPRLLASGRDLRIGADEFARSLSDQAPMLREKYASPEGRKAFLRRLIQFELLAGEAVRAGLDRDPRVQMAMKKALVERFVQQSFQAGSGESVTDAEVQAFAERRRDGADPTRKVRVAGMLFRRGDAAAQRVAAGAALEQVRRREQGNKLAFHEVARDLSEDEKSRDLGGDLGFGSHAELAARFGAGAAADLWRAAPGTLSGPLQGSEGTWIVKVTDVRDERAAPPSREEIRERLLREKRADSFRALLDRLYREAAVVIDEEELARVPIPESRMDAMNPIGAMRGMPGDADAAPGEGGRKRP